MIYRWPPLCEEAVQRKTPQCCLKEKELIWWCHLYLYCNKLSGDFPVSNQSVTGETVRTSWRCDGYSYPPTPTASSWTAVGLLQPPLGWCLPHWASACTSFPCPGRACCQHLGLWPLGEKIAAGLACLLEIQPPSDSPWWCPKLTSVTLTTMFCSLLLKFERNSSEYR